MWSPLEDRDNPYVDEQDLPSKIGSKVQHILICYDKQLQKYNVNLLSMRNPRHFGYASPSNFRTQGSFSILNSRKIFECDFRSSDGFAKFATQKPWVF